MPKQLLGALIALLAIAMLLAAVLMRRRPEATVVAPPDPAVSTLRPPPVETPPGRTTTAPRDRTSLLSLLERTGRAWVLKDHKTLDALRVPEFDDDDKAWLIAQLRGPTFIAVGACLLLAQSHTDAAVGPLGDLLKSDASIFVKDAAIDALALLQGDVALSILLGVAKGRYEASLRARAARALPAFKGPEVYRVLTDLFLNDPIASVRSAAAAAMAKLDSQQAVNIFLERLAWERKAEILTQLVIAIYHHGGEARLPELQKAIAQNAAAKGAIEEVIKRDGNDRYDFPYSSSFFAPGGPAVAVDAGLARIGITVELGKGMTLADILRPLFAAAPFDRYRALFYVRVAAEYADDLASGVPSPRAYDAAASPIGQGLPPGDLDGTVFLAFKDPATFAPGILGMTEGTKASVTLVSLLHEFGHAFAFLGDEYGSLIASKSSADNLALRTPPDAFAWKPLAERGFLPLNPPWRVELKDGVDIGTWRVPSDDCHMNNHPTDTRYCPVCQLAIIARIAELSGIPVPW